MIYALVGLVAIIAFLLLLASPFILAERLGGRLAVRLGRRWIRWLLPLILVLAAASWSTASYHALRQECARAPDLQARTPQARSVDARTKKCGGLSPSFKSACAREASLPSGYTLIQLPATQTHYWWSPPLFHVELVVAEESSDRVTASATDVVFGGGIVGSVMRLFGGDQDFEYLSCGYATADIGPWRPSLTSRPRFAAYQLADFELSSRARAKQ